MKIMTDMSSKKCRRRVDARQHTIKKGVFMRVETLIRHRTQAKEIRLSGNLCMSRTAWEQRGGIYRGSLGTAAKSGWYTVRSCELMQQPVTAEEFAACKNFAMYKDCYDEYCIKENSKKVRPCLPVFYREKEGAQ